MARNPAQPFSLPAERDSCRCANFPGRLLSRLWSPVACTRGNGSILCPQATLPDQGPVARQPVYHQAACIRLQTMVMLVSPQASLPAGSAAGVQTSLARPGELPNTITSASQVLWLCTSPTLCVSRKWSGSRRCAGPSLFSTQRKSSSSQVAWSVDRSNTDRAALSQRTHHLLLAHGYNAHVPLTVLPSADRCANARGDQIPAEC